MPSPCAVFTSAPSFSSALTALWLPCMAASATDAGDAACIRADRHSAPIALTEISVLRIIAWLPSITLADSPRHSTQRTAELAELAWSLWVFREFCVDRRPRQHHPFASAVGAGAAWFR